MKPLLDKTDEFVGVQKKAWGKVLFCDHPSCMKQLGKKSLLLRQAEPFTDQVFYFCIADLFTID